TEITDFKTFIDNFRINLQSLPDWLKNVLTEDTILFIDCSAGFDKANISFIKNECKIQYNIQSNQNFIPSKDCKISDIKTNTISDIKTNIISDIKTNSYDKFMQDKPDQKSSNSIQEVSEYLSILKQDRS